MKSFKLFLFSPSISFKVDLKGFINSQQNKTTKKKEKENSADSEI